jgi:hypothetical protein
MIYNKRILILCLASIVPFQLQNFYVTEVEEAVELCNSSVSSDLIMVIVLKMSLCLIKHNAMKAYVGVGVKLHLFLTLSQGAWSALHIGHFTPGEKACITHTRDGNVVKVSNFVSLKAGDFSLRWVSEFLPAVKAAGACS